MPGRPAPTARSRWAANGGCAPAMAEASTALPITDSGGLPQNGPPQVHGTGMSITDTPRSTGQTAISAAVPL